jgi:hypothetical protein
VNLHYFPRPYPDEAVGSLLLRACRHWLLPYKVIIREVTGTKRAYCSWLLPSYISEISVLVLMKPEEFLWKHTMFPYITGFMSPEERSRIQEKVLDGVSLAGRLSSLTKSVSQGSRYRRYCSSCAEHNVKEYCESYWHRSHQLPGSHICVEHREPLLETEIPLTGTGSSSLVLPDEADGHKYVFSTRPEVLEQIARNNHVLICGDNAEVMRYRTEAVRKGYLLSNRVIAGSMIAKDVHHYFGDELLSEMAASIHNKKQHRWPAMMIREESKGPFPAIKHVLLTTFFNAQADSPSKTDRFWRNRTLHDNSFHDLACLKASLAAIAILHETRERISVCVLLTRAGYWSRFRHRPHRYPRTCELIAAFRFSNLSARQTGGKPKSKKAWLQREEIWLQYLKGLRIE